MTANCGTLCGVCDTQHLTSDAVYWCPECDEGLCASCYKFHGASKSTRIHDVISINELNQFPSLLVDIKAYCTEHEGKYQHYCSTHESPCCPRCVTTEHKKCDLIAIDDVIKTFDTSTVFENMDQNIKRIKENIERVFNDRKQNLTSILDQKQKIQAEFTLKRAKIIQHLDTLENKLLKDLQDAEEKITLQIDNLLSELSKHRQSTEKLEVHVSALKNYSLNIQSFLGYRKINADIRSEDKLVQSLLEDSKLQWVNLECKLDEKVIDVCLIEEYGEVSSLKTPTRVELITVNARHAQLVVPKEEALRCITDMGLIRYKKIHIPGSSRKNDIKGCTFTPRGKLVFADHNNGRLVILDESGSLECEIPLSSGRPFDVTCIDENTVAVSNAYATQIEVINITSKQSEKVIKTTGGSYGICFSEGRLLYSELGKGIQVVELNDGTHGKLIQKEDEVHTFNYVTTSENRIYETRPEANAVTCRTSSGEALWEFKDESVIKTPYGITVDNNFNVYVVSNGNNSIIVISRDGKHARRLLGKGNGVNDPTCLHIDKNRNVLMVGNVDGNVFLYDVT
ncbi:unnamed protein product [Mytilus coruscus]|uniref:B box-type domain-containing protein n=1 Tax=Mytilus coruscus TaxID=42192 RepID=A0A6J8CVC8_MYTCO|nr:unnamed protein product [Mytilus coruscus]